MRIFVFSLILILFITSCSKEVEIKQNGNIVFCVESTNDNLENTIIGTIPETKRTTTAANGKGVLENIPQGAYQLYASNLNVGSGIESLTIFENKDNKVIINIDNAPPFQPKIELLEPKNIPFFDFGSSITIKAEITDDKDLLTDLHVALWSSIDGNLFDANVPTGDYFEFSTSQLNAGIHEIELKVTDTDDFESIIKFNIHVVLVVPDLYIDSISTEQEGIRLSWIRYPFPDLISYEIFQGYSETNLSSIGKNLSSVDTVFFDDEAAIGVEVFYQIKYRLTTRTEESEVKSILHKARSIDIGEARIKKMVMDPFRPYLYAINDYESNDQSLLIVNIEDCTIEKSIEMDEPQGLTLNLDASRLYVSTELNTNFGKIVEIDLNTLDVIREIELNTISNYDHPLDIEWVEGNKLVMVYSSFTKIYMLDLDTEQIVYTSSIYLHPRIIANKAKNRIYLAGNFPIDTEIIRFNVLSNALEVDHKGFLADGNFHLPTLSGDEQFLFVGTNLYSTDNFTSPLKILDWPAFASNYSGSKYSSESSLYDTENLERIRHYGFSSETVTVDPDYKNVITFNRDKGLIIFFKMDD